MNDLKFKGIKINSDLKLVYLDGEVIQLNKLEFCLLEFLIKNSNKIHTRQELLDNVWKKHESLKTVNTTISRLRKKLLHYSKYLITRSGFGYGLISDV